MRCDNCVETDEARLLRTCSALNAIVYRVGHGPDVRGVVARAVTVLRVRVPVARQATPKLSPLGNSEIFWPQHTTRVSQGAEIFRVTKHLPRHIHQVLSLLEN